MARIVKKPDVRRSEIVAAARQLFLTKEYEHATMQNVVEALNIAKGTIYHYFKSKEELLDAVIEDMTEEDHVRKRDLLKGLKGNALDKIRALIDMNKSHAEVIQQLHRPGNIGLHARLLAVALCKEAKLYHSLIQQGCEEGLFHTAHPLEAAEFLLAGVQFLTDVGIYPWSSEDLKRRACAFPALIETLLKAPKNSFHFLLPCS